YYAVQQGCSNLIGGAEGISAADCTEVQKALDAVEMSQDPVSDFNPDPPACPSGYIPNDIFYDGFESGTSQWTILNEEPIGK
ncbi:MAG: hypothetical protein GWN14_03600, partial [candidate division Zixibacteria bacterium]|nr:hypothetical protein [Gammaproteobacteria bacterium]NIX55026.1 hypothetical protein [candidate division Zixibacteria bacterium]